MKKLFNACKAFALRGNVVDLAVGIMIGSAFGKIVSSLVNDVLSERHKRPATIQNISTA